MFYKSFQFGIWKFILIYKMKILDLHIPEVQPQRKYLRKTSVLCEIAHSGKSLISIFKEPFANVYKIFFLVRRLGTRVVITYSYICLIL